MTVNELIKQLEAVPEDMRDVPLYRRDGMLVVKIQSAGVHETYPVSSVTLRHHGQDEKPIPVLVLEIK